MLFVYKINDYSLKIIPKNHWPLALTIHCTYVYVYYLYLSVKVDETVPTLNEAGQEGDRRLPGRG